MSCHHVLEITPAVTTKLDPVRSAEAAGLTYVSDHLPGISRRRRGKGFGYFSTAGKPIRDPDTLLRIRNLAIPPAYEKVWICAKADGHIQAVGYDARGRKQYRYHERWREVRDQNKYANVIDFACALPGIRRHVARDLRRTGLPREKVLAAVVRLLETTLIRVGNEEYTRTNHSYGLTTMRNRHVEIHGARVQFHFRGKSGIKHAVEIDDRRIARIIRACQDLPGEDLFEFVDENGEVHSLGSGDVNEYLQTATGKDFTAKDFRTWAGTLLAARALRKLETLDSKSTMKTKVLNAIEYVAKQLGNTRSVCRKCYIHPAVIEAYFEGTLCRDVSKGAQAPIVRGTGLRQDEKALLQMLRGRRSRKPKQKK